MNDIKIPDSRHKKNDFGVTQVGNAEPKAAEPSEQIKVKFGKFVHLVATHNFEDVMKHHGTEDIIVSTNLLTDLANAHEEQPDENRKLSLILVSGIFIGIILTYIIVRYL